MGLMLMKLLEFCQEVIILKCKNFLAHPSVPLCSVQAKQVMNYYVAQFRSSFTDLSLLLRL